MRLVLLSLIVHPAGSLAPSNLSPAHVKAGRRIDVAAQQLKQFRAVDAWSGAVGLDNAAKRVAAPREQPTASRRRRGETGAMPRCQLAQESARTVRKSPSARAFRAPAAPRPLKRTRRSRKVGATRTGGSSRRTRRRSARASPRASTRRPRRSTARASARRTRRSSSRRASARAQRLPTSRDGSRRRRGPGSSSRRDPPPRRPQRLRARGQLQRRAAHRHARGGPPPRGVRAPASKSRQGEARFG